MAIYNWSDGERLTAEKLNSWSAEIEGIKTTVEGYKDDTEEFKNSASGSSASASASKDAAALSESNAATSEANALSYKNEASASATTSSANKLDSEAWAVGTRGGVPVGASDPAYHNNAKYYKDQAGQIVGNDYVRSVNDVLPDENGNVDVESDVFVVTFTATEETTAEGYVIYFPDKTKTDLANAMASGKTIYAFVNNAMLGITTNYSSNPRTVRFNSVQGRLTRQFVWSASDDTPTKYSNRGYFFPTETLAPKTDITTSTLLASAWSNGEYSFESTYPVASYNIEVEIDGDSATEEQIEAWSGAKMMGSATANKLYAKGDVPTVDIPIILKVVAK